MIQWLALILLMCGGTSFAGEGMNAFQLRHQSVLKKTKYSDFCVITGDVNTHENTFSACKGAYSIDRIELIASASKLVTSVVLMDLVQRKVLSLETRVSDVLSEWKDLGPKSNITLRQLLSFTSGLRSHKCTNRNINTFNECVEKIRLAKLEFSPGSSFDYSGVHMHVAAQMAIYKLGLKTWNQVFEKFKKKYDVFSEDSKFYNIRGKKELNPLAAGGLHTSARLYAEFLSKLLSKSILSQSSFEIIFSNHTNKLSVHHSPISNGIKESWDYGLGVWVECENATADNMSECGQVLRYSSPGAFGFYPWISSDLKRWGVIAMRGKFGIFKKRPDVLGITIGREFHE